MDGPDADDATLGRHLDITDLDPPGETPMADSATSSHRVWVGVYYECCAAYARVYRRPDDLRYQGRCPECGASVSIRVGPNGIAARMLIATPV
ncbi:MAG TPA: hypothetical protein PK093_22790 [Phycisphaerae bacterium]|nr:hypothetical protein [Phycisphaerae bacterium]